MNLRLDRSNCDELLPFILATVCVKKASCKKKIEFRECEDCAGSGICSECKGEGFVLKKLSEENAERARKRSQNMATRFTSGYYLYFSLFLSSQVSFEFILSPDFYSLPKKWSYSTKCTSSRSCPTCGGSGKLSI